MAADASTTEQPLILVTGSSGYVGGRLLAAPRRATGAGSDA